MCINASTPAWVRVRHWSAPERIKHEDQQTSNQENRLPWEVPLTLDQKLDALLPTNLANDSLQLQQNQLHCVPLTATEMDSIPQTRNCLDRLLPSVKHRLREQDLPPVVSVHVPEQRLNDLAVFSHNVTESCTDVPEQDGGEGREKDEGGGGEEDEARHSDRGRKRASKKQEQTVLSEERKQRKAKSNSTAIRYQSSYKNMLTDTCRQCRTSLVTCECGVRTKKYVRNEEEDHSWKKKRRKKKFSFVNSWTSYILQCVSALFIFSALSVTPVHAEICGSVTLKHVSDLIQLRDCDVIEGNLVLALGIMEPSLSNRKSMPAINATFPKLREITDYFMVYGSQFSTKLTHMFPNLSVIRGNKLMENWALVIYKNTHLEEIGLTGLTKIMRGAVRIELNPKLCYVQTIDWKALTQEEFHEHNRIEGNQVQNACPEYCPTHCHVLQPYKNRHSCWNQDNCQRVEVTCSDHQVSDRNNKICYQSGGRNGSVDDCDKMCIGGCSGRTPTDCHACQHVFWMGNSGKKQCQNMCPSGLLKFKNWRCITNSDCSGREIRFPGVSIEDVHYFKIYNGTCLEKCPPDTKESMLADGTHICEECKDCPKKCSGTLISSVADLVAFEGCTHILGELNIQISGSNVVHLLSKYLGRIQEIGGFLKISRTYPIVSLDFFENLKYIWGRNLGEAQYSLQILGNENLQRLFPIRKENGVEKTVQIRRTENGSEYPGSAFIHYNARLCRSEIEQMLRLSRMHDPGESSADISYATNGEKAICGARRLRVQIGMVEAKIATILFENYQQVIAEKWPLATVRTLLGYEINYREIDRATYLGRNLTKYDGRDACGNDDWIVSDHQPSTQTEDENGQMRWPEEFDFLKVKPYKYYAVFISTLLLKEYSGSKGVQGAESEILYFMTPEDIPDPPESVYVERTNSSSVNITWQPPLVPNGEIDHYEIVLEFNAINVARALDRPYCSDGYRAEDMEIKEREALEKEKKDFANRTSIDTVNVAPDGSCDCDTCGNSLPTKKILSEDSKLEGEMFFDAVINRVWNSPTSSQGFERKKRATNEQGSVNNLVEGGPRKNSFNELKKMAEEEEVADQVDVIVEKSQSSSIYSYKRPKNKQEPGKGFYLVYSAKVSGNTLHHYIPNLKHYGSYTLKLRACQKPYVKNQTKSSLPDDSFFDFLGSTNQTLSKREVSHALVRREDLEGYEKYCSMDVVKEVRVLHKPQADDIRPDSLMSYTENDTNSVWITWDPPADPNELIVNYNLHMKQKQDMDSLKHCITAKQFRDKGFRYAMTFSGSFYVSVQAVSVYGPGNWTEFVYVSVAGETSKLLLAILLPLCLILLLIFSVGIGVYYVKQKNETGVIISANGEYISVAELYKFNEWEVDRNLVEIFEKLGSGAFGQVHRGVYHHPEKGTLECAIKSPKDGASHETCLQFLLEAHTMKAFDTEHVIKLYGVATRCQPHLVLLELMANGDLKTYLRSLRPDAEENKHNKPPPTTDEIRQMALDIADGMAYLSTHHRHIIHRDLAARNCLVSANSVVKIADFGMAREIYTTDYYRKGDKGLMPVRWMAPESLRDGKATSASDVWSFGIVLWEMVTLAEQPYISCVSNLEVIDNVCKGYIMPKPPTCPDDIYNLMKECWQMKPSHRPTFLDLCERLSPNANDRFRNNSFFFSDAGRKAIESQSEERRLKEEEEEAALAMEETPCLTGNGNSNGDATVSISAPNSAGITDNGHVTFNDNTFVASSSDLRAFNRQTSSGGGENSLSGRIPSVTFSNKWNFANLNGIGKKLRHKSGSASGEA